MIVSELALSLLFGVFFLLLVLGTPVAFALAMACAASLIALGLPVLALMQQTAAGTSSVSLLTIPLFIFAGELMSRGGLSDRLIGFATAAIGHIRGGLGQVNILASFLFGGVSGSAIADVTAIGGTMIPQMKARGYDTDYAVNVTITAALIALLVPPSHNMILYSAAAGGRISITDLFAAGIVPAILLSLALMVTAYAIARRRGYAKSPFPGLATFFARFGSAIPGLLMIVIIFGGVRAGIFTATESACIAVLYAAVVSLIVYRNTNRHDYVEAVISAVKTTGVIMLVIGTAAAFGWIMAYLEVPAATVALMQSITDNPIMILLMINIALLILGTFMDMAPMIIICTPIFLPVAKAYGIDPIQFGVILILNSGIGLITPPVGNVLFAGASIGKVSSEHVMKTIWPYYGACVFVLMLVSFVPAVSLWLPQVLK